VNDLLTNNYYRILITDPITNCLIVAPYVTYAIQCDHAEVSGTYGRGHSIHTQVLQPIPMDYYCPPLTPPQISILDTNVPYADAVNRILNEQFPLHLSAAIRCYQHFKAQQYEAQREVTHLQKKKESKQNKKQQQLEKAMCILSKLENANILGHLIPYEDEIIDSLTAKPYTAGKYLHATQAFNGVITQSAIDACPNPFRNDTQDNRTYNRKQLYEQTAQEVKDQLQDAADAIEDKL